MKFILFSRVVCKRYESGKEIHTISEKKLLFLFDMIFLNNRAIDWQIKTTINLMSNIKTEINDRKNQSSDHLVLKLVHLSVIYFRWSHRWLCLALLAVLSVTRDRKRLLMPRIILFFNNPRKSNNFLMPSLTLQTIRKAIETKISLTKCVILWLKTNFSKLIILHNFQ